MGYADRTHTRVPIDSSADIPLPSGYIVAPSGSLIPGLTRLALTVEPAGGAPSTKMIIADDQDTPLAIFSLLANQGFIDAAVDPNFAIVEAPAGSGIKIVFDPPAEATGYAHYYRR